MPVLHASALLFDLDGVLIDSTPAVQRVWTAWATQHNFDPADTVRRAHGRPSLTTVRELLPDADHQAVNRLIEQAEMDDTEDVIPLPGVLALLASLPPHRWTIVTSCTRRLAEVRIRAAGLPMPAHFLTSTDVTQGKPHPEPYLKGAALLGFPPQNCIVIEDAPAGIKAGKAAGARVIALRTTSPDSDLQQAGADWLCTNCANLHLMQDGLHGLELQLD